MLQLGPGRRFPKRSQDDIEIGCCDDSVIAADDYRIAVFDGRLDYADDLRCALGEAANRSANPAQLMLLAHAKWGADFCEHIEGEYCCALWEGRDRRLILATDPLASRPLYYWQDRERLLFATEMRALMSDSAVPRELSRKSVAKIVAIQPLEPEHTIYRDICRVPGGHSVTWEKQRIRSARWWRPEERATLRLGSDREYEEALLAIFEAAVACRIGTDEPIAAHLSGGLDSSSVTTLAARQLAAQGREITAYTAVPRHDFTLSKNNFGNEWAHAALVAGQHSNIRHRRIDNDGVTFMDSLQKREMAHEWPIIASNNLRWFDAIDRDAHGRGVKILLSGQMGNMTISYDGIEYYADLLRSGHYLKAFHAAREAVRSGSSRWLAVANETAHVMLPLTVHRQLLDMMGKRPMRLRDYSLIEPAFAEELGLACIGDTTGGDFRKWPNSDGRRLRLFMLTNFQHVLGDWRQATRRLYNIDMRDPTVDRRLAEFSFAVPQEQFKKAGVPRSLLRRTMRGILPDTLVNERRKGRQAADAATSLAVERSELLAEARHLRNSDFAPKSIDLDRMEAMLESWTPPEPGKTTDQMQPIMALRGLAAGRFIKRYEGGN
ncbi:MAG: asparagine synthase-related protein [Novosphingobium sp.]